jgi:hypothetical protein
MLRFPSINAGPEVRPATGVASGVALHVSTVAAFTATARLLDLMLGQIQCSRRFAAITRLRR